ncbi:T9SS type A sorting domain-containing protein [Winogradskyella sp. R77965]|uniref:T9SS type A sorting domain-containing protein n=1 Tax=Winogradskyella sp. R77965 TaxID=3093872 RepID=UPI0037DC9578
MNLKNYSKFCFTATLIFLFSIRAFSQNIECGFKYTSENQEYFNSIKNEVKALEEQFLQQQTFSRNSTATNSIPIKAHIIRQSNGDGGLPLTDLEDAITELNSVFEVVGLSFFLCEGINYIDSDAFYDFQSVEENSLTNANSLNGVLNIYFTGSASSNGTPVCGYAYFPGGPETIMMVNSCTGSGFGTLPHEMGHFLALSHTHGNSNVDGSSQELVNGSNCESTGDFICDTPADPLLQGKVSGACIYFGNDQDVNGDFYVPDPLNIMSYSRNQCLTVFSPQQIARMKAIYQISRTNLICPSFSPDFDANVTLSCDLSQTINFTDNSIGAISWAWDVDGDDITDYITQNITHTYNETGSYDVALTISDGTSNASKVKRQYISVGAMEINTSTIALSLTLDDNASETSWQFLDGNNTVIYSGGPYTGPFDANNTITETFTINTNECYAFQINDSIGDGICCSSGNGSYQLRADDNSLLATGGDIGYGETNNFFNGTLSISDFSSESIRLFPNPSSHSIVITTKSIPDSYVIYNTLGQILKTSQVKSNTDLEINIESLNSAMYFIKLTKDSVNQVLSFIKN